jgi:hypothetical protein
MINDSVNLPQKNPKIKKEKVVSEITTYFEINYRNKNIKKEFVYTTHEYLLLVENQDKIKHQHATYER